MVTTSVVAIPNADEQLSAGELGRSPVALELPDFGPPEVVGEVVSSRAATDLDLSDAWEPAGTERATYVERTVSGAVSGGQAVAPWKALGFQLALTESESESSSLSTATDPDIEELSVEVRRLSSEAAASVSQFGNAVALAFGPSGSGGERSPQVFDVGLEINPSEFVGGADQLGRLRLVRYDGCTEVDGVVECDIAQPLKSLVDPESGHVTATMNEVSLAVSAADVMQGRANAGLETAPLALPGVNDGQLGSLAPDSSDPFVVVALQVGATSGAGDFTATPVESLSVYEIASYTGSAEASYTVPLPEAAAGPTPSVAFTYSSSSIDGMNSSSNNQAGPVGLGWSFMAGGSITREFGTCNPLADGSVPQDKCPTAEWGDLDEERFSITLNGVSSRLIRVSGNEFRLLNDPMWRVFRRTNEANHGFDGDESWEVQTPDGTRWLFGRTENSARNVPVYFQAEFGDRPPGCTDINRICDMVYQWDLERAIDTLDNTVEYSYLRETNYYNARGLGSRPYIRASSLRDIAYGFNSSIDGADNAGKANARVVFDWEQRCADSRSAARCTPEAEQFPDVPVDQWCRSASVTCQSNRTPTFFTFLRLGSVRTQIRQSDLSWLNRDVHDLIQYFPEFPDDVDGDSNQTKLVLAQIRQRPNGTDTGGFHRHYGFSPIRGVDFDTSVGSVSAVGVSGEIGFDAVASELSNGSELSYGKVWLGGSGDGAAGEVAIRYANGAAAGSVEVVANGITLATVDLPATPGFADYRTVTAPVSGAVNAVDLTLRFSGPTSEFARLAWVQFNASEFDQLPGLPPVDYGSNGNWEFKPNRVNAPTGIASMIMPRIKTITNELGAAVTFDYSEPDCDTPAEPQWNLNVQWCYPAFDTSATPPAFVAWYKYTVDEMVVDPGSGQPTITTKYAYDRPRWAHSNPSNDCDSDPTWNEFRGHNRVRITDPSGISEYLFFQGMAEDQSDCSDLRSITGPVEDSQGNPFTDSRWLQGQSYEMIRFDPAGNELERETTSYDTEAGPFTSGNERGIFTTAGSGKDAARFVAPAGTSSTILIGQDQTKQTDYRYDQFGNVVREDHEGDTSNPADNRVLSIDYATNTDLWIVQTSCRETMAPKSELEAIVTETRWGYDTDRSQVPATACTTAPTKGLMTNEWSYVTETQATQLTTGYNQRGQATSNIDPRGNADRLGLDPLQGWLRNDTNPLGWVNSYDYDELGHQIEIVDVNDNVTRLTHDGYDRLSQVWLPGVEADPSYAFEYFLEERPVEVLTKTLFDESRTGEEQYLLVAEYIDGLSRPVQRQSRAQSPGNRWVTSMAYDNAGRLLRESTAYEIPGEPGSNAVTPAGDWSTVPLHHVYSYDGRDEMTRDRTLGNAADQATTDWSTRYVYDGWTTQIFDEDGFRTDHVHDAFANPVTIIEYDEDEATYATTVHTYDAADRLRTTTDDQGNVLEVGYDRLGRRVELDDPNVGRWLFEYDPNSNLTLQRDGRGVWTGFDYDPIDRVEQRFYSDENGALVDRQASYEYDDIAGRDRLYRKTAFTPEGEVVVENPSYDAQGQILEQLTTVPGDVGGEFRQRFDWGPGGQQTEVHYPLRNNGEIGEKVTTSFDWRTGQPLGLESDVRGVLVHDTRYGADGQRRSRSYGPGGSDLVENWDIDIRTERTTSYTAGTLGQADNVISFGYTYNDRGDTTLISDGVNAGQTQCFRYDAQSRLKQAFTGTDDCSNPDMGRGQDPYDESYDYDTIHNLTLNEVKGALSYGEGDGPAGPQAVTSTASGDSYSYDYAGNQTVRVVDGRSQTIRFDAQNQIDRIEGIDAAGEPTAVESYLYDADHNRVLRHQAGNAVVYIGETYEWTNVGPDIVPRTPGPDPQVPTDNPDGEMPRATAIAGRVTTSGGLPVAKVPVDLFRADDKDNRTEFLGSVQTGEDGAYRLDVKPGCYVLVFIAPDGSSFESGRYFDARVCVEQGQTATIDAALEKASAETAIAGRVSTSDGSPVAKVPVDLFQASGDGSRSDFLGSVSSGEDGAYRLDVKPGCYVLVFIAPDGYSFKSGRYFEAPICADDSQVVHQDAKLRPDKPAPHPDQQAGDGNPAGNVQAVAAATGIASPAIEAEDEASILIAEGMTAHYFLGGRRVAVLQSGDLKYTLQDHLNSAAANVGRDGSTEIARYRPWGQERTEPLAGSLGYGGQRRSDRTGLLDFDTRFYDPGLGRFISPDANVPDFSDPAALNRYAYVANNPMTYFDPTGEWGLSSVKNAVKKVAKTTVAVTKTVAKAASKVDPHMVLDVAGMLPDPVGMAADLANAALYLAEGDYKNAAISGLAMLPVVGTGAAVMRKACKLGCDKAVKGVSSIADDAAGQAARRTGGLPCNSFASGTMVYMADGSRRAIEQVQVGDEVRAADPLGNGAESRVVTQLIFSHGTKTLVEIEVAGAHIAATEEHPFWAANTSSWVDAADLRPGDLLLTARGHEVAIDSVRTLAANVQRVHNITVAGLHTYFVFAGDAPVLNHNASCPLQGMAQDIASKVSFRGTPTVAVAQARDQAGGVTTLVAHSGRARLSNVAAAASSRGANYVFNARSARLQRLFPAINHAERHLLRHARQNGLTILRGGTSTGICRPCQQALRRQGLRSSVRATGQRFGSTVGNFSRRFLR